MSPLWKGGGLPYVSSFVYHFLSLLFVMYLQYAFLLVLTLLVSNAWAADSRDLTLTALVLAFSIAVFVILIGVLVWFCYSGSSSSRKHKHHRLSNDIDDTSLSRV